MKNTSKQIVKIALVANTSWSLFNFRIDVIRFFIQEDIDVYVIAPRDDYSDKLVAEGAIFIPLKLNNYSTSMRSEVSTFLHLFRIYRKYQFDHILHYTIKPNIYGSLAAGLNRNSNIAVVTGLGKTFQFPPLLQYFLNRLYALSLKCADEVWFLNDENLKKFVSKNLIDKDKGFVLPSEGVDTRKFKSDHWRGSIMGSIKFLFAGRLLKDKGIFEYVQMAKAIVESYDDVSFEIAGFIDPENPNSISLDDISEWQSAGWISYLGSHQDIRPFLANTDCLILPSFYEEGVSRILLEAASMAKPIITTDQTGCRDVVIHGVSGLIVRKRSVEDLINAVEFIMDLSDDERKEYGREGRQLVKENFDIQKVIQIYNEKILDQFTHRQIPG